MALSSIYTPTFFSPCESSGDFTTSQQAAGDTLAIGGTNGIPKGSISLTMVSGNTGASYYEKDLGAAGTCRILQFEFRIRSQTVFTGAEDIPIVHMASNQAVGTSLLDIRIKYLSSTTYNISLVDPINGYATTSVGAIKHQKRV